MKLFGQNIHAGQIRTLLYVLVGSVWGAALYLNWEFHLKSTPQVRQNISQNISQSTTVPASSEKRLKGSAAQVLPSDSAVSGAIAPPPQRAPTPAPAAPALAPSPVAATVSMGRPRLVIRLHQKKVTLYRGAIAIKSYPVAVGRAGWETPKGEFQVMRMIKNPTWINPLTDAVIPGGTPGNPLGKYWIAFWTDGTNWIGFHGTPDPGSVGTAASHGCIRMYNADVEELFHQVTPGTPVTVE